MFKWFRKYFPDTYEFIRNFFKALNNKNEGHSLRKWLSVGFFWLIGEAVLRYTDENNLVSVITVLSGMITTLIVTYTVGNYQERKLEKSKTQPENTNESAG
jgi:hypothetical protein